jgi:hypothetical protein
MKTTKKDFQTFKVDFLKWTSKFGLADIHFDFVHTECTNYAQVVGDHNQKSYVVFLSKDFTDMIEIPKGFIKYIAYHEACECLLYRLRTIAMNREFNPEELDSEVHTVINRLEKLLFDGCYFDVEVDSETIGL